MSLEPISATGLACWASYLINGDSSGIEPEDIAAADSFVRDCLEGVAPCTCEPCGFMWRPDSWHAMPLGGDCELYTSLVKRESASV